MDDAIAELAQALRRAGELFDELAGRLDPHLDMRRLTPDYDLETVAEALGMSTRWIRNQIRYEGLSHQRYGNTIRFTEQQVADLRRRYTHQEPLGPITTGPRKSRKTGEVRPGH